MLRVCLWAPPAQISCFNNIWNTVRRWPRELLIPYIIPYCIINIKHSPQIWSLSAIYLLHTFIHSCIFCIQITHNLSKFTIYIFMHSFSYSCCSSLNGQAANIAALGRERHLTNGPLAVSKYHTQHESTPPSVIEVHNMHAQWKHVHPCVYLTSRRVFLSSAPQPVIPAEWVLSFTPAIIPSAVLLIIYFILPPCEQTRTFPECLWMNCFFMPAFYTYLLFLQGATQTVTQRTTKTWVSIVLTYKLMNEGFTASIFGGTGF